jgi:hypothetical protein
MNRFFSRTTAWAAVLTLAGLCCRPARQLPDICPEETPLARSGCGARWIELSPVVVAAESFYPQKLTVPSGELLASPPALRILRPTLKPSCCGSR